MTTWLTTEEVAAHLRVSRDVLMPLVLVPHDRPAWSLYAGEHGRRTARYRWRADRLDDWFEEVCRWRASASGETAGSSDGETADGELEPTKSPSAASGEPTRSPKRSKKRSSGTGGTSLVVLAERLLSR